MKITQTTRNHKIWTVGQNQINRNISLVRTTAFRMCRGPLCVKQRSATKQTHKAISTSWSMEPANCTRSPCLQGENFANNRITHKEDGNFGTFQFRCRLFWVFVCVLLASSNFGSLFPPGSISDCAKWLIDSVNSKVMKVRLQKEKRAESSPKCAPRRNRRLFYNLEISLVNCWFIYSSALGEILNDFVYE